LNEYRSVANASLPLEWFYNVGMSLKRAFGDQWQLLLITDGKPEQLTRLTDAFAGITTADMSDSDCSDILALAGADLLVCSASTFSSLAAFLSDSPYLWFGPSLHAHPEGCVSTHDFSEEHNDPNGPTARAVQDYVHRSGPWRARGTVVGIDGLIPAPALADAVARHALRNASSDLVRSGVAMAPETQQR
jgi:hypothetical protein